MAVDIHTTVHHKLYGKGEVIKITGDNVYVAFGIGQRIFRYPEAFVKGYLSADAEIDMPPSDKKDDEREVILDTGDDLRFDKIYEAINAAVGTNHTGWMKATWPNVHPNLPFRIWFVKLAETKNGVLVPAAHDCLNTISDDWNEVVFDDLKDKQDDGIHSGYPGISLIFAKEPKGGPYIFRGAFITDEEKSKAKHHVSKRIGTRVKLIGSPAYAIEILDDFRKRE